MKVAVFNAGSSSLKSRLIEGSAEPEEPLHDLASLEVDRIGEGGPETHAHAAAGILERLAREAGPGGIDALAHRIVHGGERFTLPVRLDDEALAALEDLGEIAPLHNAKAVSVINACLRQRPDLPQVAVFDTAFHAGLPDRAAAYAIDPELARRHRVRRFGFHGIAYRSMIERYSAFSGRPAQTLRLVAFQLGNGASACAIARGRSVETSMGFTPLEGLVMGSRSGDLDPALVPYLAERERTGAADIVELLNQRSGLLGVSGISRDVREIEDAAAKGDARARLALDLFAYRARKFLGAYLAVLGYADAVLFGGGIGEHAPSVRADIVGGLEELGLRLDPDANRRQREGSGRISSPDSKIEIWALRTDEESVIARDAIYLLTTEAGGGGRSSSPTAP